MPWKAKHSDTALRLIKTSHWSLVRNKKLENFPIFRRDWLLQVAAFSQRCVNMLLASRSYTKDSNHLIYPDPDPIRNLYGINLCCAHFKHSDWLANKSFNQSWNFSLVGYDEIVKKIPASFLFFSQFKWMKYQTTINRKKQIVDALSQDSNPGPLARR